MGVEDTAILIVFAVDLEEMSSEVLDDGFVVVGPVPERSDAKVMEQMVNTDGCVGISDERTISSL